MNKLKTYKKQTSESFRLAILLTLSGAFQDAYTYNLRDHVFSNAQTGNIVLMSQNLMTGNFHNIIKYLLPILTFGLGVYLAEKFRFKFKGFKKIHWRQIIILIEIIFLFAIGFIPDKMNLVATSLVSFTCAMQVQAFKKLHGYSFATTMCIGNLRSAMENLSNYTRTKSYKYFEKLIYYLAILITFAIGAGLGGLASLHFGLKSIWFCPLMLIGAYLLMLKEEI